MMISQSFSGNFSKKTLPETFSFTSYHFSLGKRRGLEQVRKGIKYLLAPRLFLNCPKQLFLYTHTPFTSELRSTNINFQQNISLCNSLLQLLTIYLFSLMPIYRRKNKKLPCNIQRKYIRQSSLLLKPFPEARYYSDSTSAQNCGFPSPDYSGFGFIDLYILLVSTYYICLSSRKIKKFQN